MNCNRLANGSEIEAKRRKQAEGHGHSISRARRSTSRGGMRFAVPPYACCVKHELVVAEAAASLVQHR
jgi:hypothetical protein